MLLEFKYTEPNNDTKQCGFIDLAWLCRSVHDRVGPLPPGYLRGKTAIRDGAMALLGCSAVEAERLVDEMEHAGYIQFIHGRSRAAPGVPRWRFVPDARLAAPAWSN